MAQQISDLVINLDVDSATFTEQIARIKGQPSGVANESEKVQTRMRSAAEAQITALKTTSDAGAGAVSDMQRRQADAAAGLQNELQRVSKSVDETYQRVTGLNQRYRENDAQAEALARRQDALAESFFRQIDGVRTLNGETRTLASIQEQFRKARAQGNITQGDYLSLTLPYYCEAERAPAGRGKKRTWLAKNFFASLRPRWSNKNYQVLSC
ncbi:hypothetical protein LNP05_13865 [Klebsiella pneumoniae subsp. pneumoniae]|nr:hypothetical protein [Klebsiella pneumoniae subsp. pneumoniae]